MGRIVLRTTIDAPLEVVFELLTDIERVPEYSTLTEELTCLTPGPIRENTRWGESNPIGPIPTTGEWRVQEFDPPEHFVFAGEASFVDARVAFDLMDWDGKTHVEQVTTYEFPPDWARSVGCSRSSPSRGCWPRASATAW